MKKTMKKTMFYLTALFEKTIVLSIVNKIFLRELDKINSKASDRIQRKFPPLAELNPRPSMNEYCLYVIKHLEYQNLISDEIKNEIRTLGISLNLNDMLITNNLAPVKEKKK